MSNLDNLESLRLGLERCIEQQVSEQGDWIIYGRPKMSAVAKYINAKRMNEEELQHIARRRMGEYKGIREYITRLEKAAPFETLSEQDSLVFFSVCRGAAILEDRELIFKVLQCWAVKGGRSSPAFFIAAAAMLGFSDEMKKFFYEKIIELANSAPWQSSSEDVTLAEELILEYEPRFREIEGSKYNREELERKFFEVCLPQSKTDKEGCFIATAVYGSRSWQVRLLRNFRDTILLPSTVGRFLTATYYRYAPAVSVLIEKSPRLQAFARLGLDRLIQFLRRRRPDLEATSLLARAEIPSEILWEGNKCSPKSVSRQSTILTPERQQSIVDFKEGKGE